MTKIPDKTSRDTRVNLATLATYLESLPKDYREFEMADFFYSKGEDGDEYVVKYLTQNGSVQSCGTAACAVGHGPAAHLFMTKHELPDDSESSPLWTLYCERVFGISQYQRAFDWLFGGYWSSSDNTHRGAAARIRYYLDKGVPDGFVSQEGKNFVSSYQEYLV